MKRFRVSLAVIAAVLAAASCAEAAAPLKEDLSGCKLPHGELTLPSPDTVAGAKGTFIKFSDGSAASLPLADGGRPLAPAVAAEKLRASGKADIAYNSEDDGTLWVLSGRALDLGTSYLHDAAATKLTRPLEMHGDGQKPSGLYGQVQEGRTFLVETADAHYVLMRVLEKSSDGLRVQYVYQPSGEIRFDVPNAPLVLNAAAEARTPPAPVESPALAAVTPLPVVMPTPHPLNDSALSPAKRTVLEPSMYVFDEQRQLLIQRRLERLNGPAGTAGEIADKVQAIEDLVDIRADEAIEPFIRQIAFLDARRTNKEFSQENVHPFYAALKKMGHPAVEGALKELAQMDVPAGKEDNSVDGPLYRARLLGQVIRAIEGDDVAEFIFKRERDRSTDPSRKALYDLLINPKN